MINDYLVPDYFPSFSCKMGACRTACCEGWPISISRNDYFRLLSVECSEELRRRLDVSMHLADYPTPERYALISPRYDGQCPLRMEDGRCRLHAELGEGFLSAVCRLYPRGFRNRDGMRECSCANSCEAVLELLYRHEPPLSFIRLDLDADVPPAPERKVIFETAGREEEIRLWLIGHIQNRAYSLPRRMLLLGEAMQALDQALSLPDTDRLQRLLSGEEKIPVPEGIEADAPHLLFGLDAARKMIAIMDERSDSIRSYGEAAIAYFGEDEAAFDRYEKARGHFGLLVPAWQNWFEGMLVNHMFFSHFPFQDRPVALKDEYLALCAVYALMRFLCLGWMATHGSIDAAIDVCAAAFRLIDHTEFDRYAAPILKDLNCDDWLHLRRLLCL